MIDRTTFPYGLLKYHAQMLARDGRSVTFRQLHLVQPPAPRVISESIIDLHAPMVEQRLSRGSGG